MYKHEHILTSAAVCIVSLKIDEYNFLNISNLFLSKFFTKDLWIPFFYSFYSAAAFHQQCNLSLVFEEYLLRMAVKSEEPHHSNNVFY